MTNLEIIKIVFGTLLSLGAIVLFLLAFTLFYKYLIQEKRCTNRTTGIVKKYTLLSHGGDKSGIHLPVVFYNVNGKEYKVAGPEYRYYKVRVISSPMAENSVEYHEENQVFTIDRTANSFVRVYGNPMAKLYPLDSEVDVYYDPEKPELSYVQRY